MTRRIATLSLAFAFALVTGAAGPAAACGMYEEPSIESAMDRIASARDLLEKGELREAAAFARSVARDRRADKKVRAEAYSLAGVIRWKQGNEASAKANFKKALALDPSQYEMVVAKQADAVEIRAIVEKV